jgi:endonuclease/exonuclease/phosphatase family metal-dependent hydrolase
MDKHLKIVTYNIHHGRRQQAIIRNIKKLAALGTNIFCLQEVRKNSGENFLLDSLLKQLGKDWKIKYLIEPEKHDLGLCILWKNLDLKADNFQSILLPKYPKARFYEKPLKKLSSRHPWPVQRAALVGDFVFNGKSLRVINLHLDWLGGFTHKGLQINHIHSKLRLQVQPDYQVICGDFNTVGFFPFSKRRSKKIEGLLGADFKNTFDNKMTTSHMQMLDHIFVKNMALIKSKVFKYSGSDHFPLLAEIIPLSKQS